MSLKRYLFASYAALIFELAAVLVAGQGDELKCDPCIDRPTYRIRAIVHGTSDDMFWQRMRASSIQAGNDMRVQLDFELYDEYDPDLMAGDIETAATGLFPPDALIVTIPNPSVEKAIAKAVKYVPIFGMNSGYDVANRVGVLDFIAMDEHEGGRVAGEEFLKENRNITRALYINHSKGNNAMDQRFLGFGEGLGGDITVEELVVDLQQPNDAAAKSISSAVESCNYDTILLGGTSSTLEMTLTALNSQNCPLPISLGSFDENYDAYAAIATRKLSFVISQQSHLQATMSVVAAATYATTEKKLSSSQASFGTYLSGPVVVNLSNLPSDSLQVCEDDAFPVCPNNKKPDGEISSCECLDRKKIKIAGVLHGITTDSFWDIVFEQAIQAADDLGVELKLDRLEPQPSSDVWHTKMALQIISLCNEGVDGIFITIPSDIVHDAIRHCQSLNIPVISVNSGAADAKKLNLIHHISQIEYQAGFEAGSRMAEEGITSAIVLSHEEGNNEMLERSSGFEDGLKSVSSDIKYIGLHFVPIDSKLVFIEIVQKIIGIEGDWDGIGALSIGAASSDALIMVQELHPKLTVGTFDTNDKIFEYLDAGALLFGIDQNAFMQGYMPVWLLTTMAHTKQHLQNQYIETGPKLIENAPSNALKACTTNNFSVCKPPVDINKNQIEKIRPVGFTLAAISMSLSLGLLAWVWYYRDAAVVRKSQPLFLGMICVGTFLMAATIIPLSVDDSFATVESCTIACIATPWFFWIGFVITFSALFSKIYRINKLFTDASVFRRVKITAWDVMPPFCILLTLTLIFLSVWSFVDPMYWIRQDTIGSIDGLSTFGSCRLGSKGVSKVMLWCLIVLALACVILACFAAWHGRNISVEYSESRYVTVIVIAMLQAFPLGIPLIFLSHQSPIQKYFVEVAIIFVLTLTVLLLIFGPKIGFLRKEKSGIVGGISSTQQSASRIFASINGSIDNRSGITRKQAEDLKRKIVEIGTINDSINFSSLFKSVGIPMLDEYNFRNSENRYNSKSTNTNATITSSRICSSTSCLSSTALQPTIVEEDEESRPEPATLKST